MRVRTFTVPFSRIVGEEARELEFGAEDFTVVRPLFGLSFSETRGWQDRIREVEDLAERLSEFSEDEKREAEAKADALVLDMMRAGFAEWHLSGPNGPIPMPGTPEALDALPAGLRTRIYPFLSTYRGEDPNPSTRT